MSRRSANEIKEILESVLPPDGEWTAPKKPEKRDDKTALSWWFPKVREAGLRVPATEIVEMPENTYRDMWAFFDHGDPSKVTDADFVADLREAIEKVGGAPCFLRTDHTSAKHEWSRACHVSDAEGVMNNVCAIVYYSELCGMFGELPWDRWAVRELLPTKPLGVCPGYFDFPVCREFRFFAASESGVICWHPYWPENALQDGGAREIGLSNLYAMTDEDLTELTSMAETAALACGGAWSVDFLDTERGWFLTDMAEAHKSFHWEGCDKAP